jgi:hypothetical protein
MEQIQTSSVTSKILGISTRMLRYYDAYVKHGRKKFYENNL